MSIPFGDDCRYDLVVDRDGKLERVQCKYTESDGKTVKAKCCSTVLSPNGLTKTKTYYYTSDDIDWLIVYDKYTNRCYYIPSSKLKTRLCLRLKPSKNNQQKFINYAKDFLDF